MQSKVKDPDPIGIIRIRIPGVALRNLNVLYLGIVYRVVKMPDFPGMSVH